jgi:hypothetical protein
MIAQLVDALVKEITNLIDNKVISVDDLKAVAYRFPFRKLPAKSGGIAPEPQLDLPAIVVQFDDTHTDDPLSEKGKIVRISLIVGLINNNPQNGIATTLQVAETLEKYFIDNPVLIDEFRLEYPTKIKLFNEQPHPQYFCGLEMDWNVPQPNPNLHYNGE